MLITVLAENSHIRAVGFEGEEIRFHASVQTEPRQTSDYYILVLTQLFTPAVVWRSTGITLTGLVYGEREQLDLFQPAKKSDDRLGSILDELEEKFGKNIVHLG